jgi:hypothetical protein
MGNAHPGRSLERRGGHYPRATRCGPHYLQNTSVLEEAMSEVLAVARAHGAGVSAETVKQSLASLDRAPAEAIGNLRDILDGRPSELETEVGAVVRLARTAESTYHGMSSFMPASCRKSKKRVDRSNFRLTNKKLQGPHDTLRSTFVEDQWRQLGRQIAV